MIQQILTDKLPQVRELLKKHKVKKAYAFGSVCTDHFNKASDIDFLIAFEDNLDPMVEGESWWNLLEGLKIIFNMKGKTTTRGICFWNAIKKTLPKEMMIRT